MQFGLRFFRWCYFIRNYLLLMNNIYNIF
eukprot:UN15318